MRNRQMDREKKSQRQTGEYTYEQTIYVADLGLRRDKK